MKKIIHIINGLDVGGTETALYRLLQITRDTYQLHVIVLNQAGHYSEKIKGLGIPIEYLNLRNNPVMACLRLKAMLQHHQPDIVQTWLYHADLIGGLIAKYCGVKQIIWGIRCEGTGLKKSTALIQFICAKLSDKIPSHIVTNSKKAADYHIRKGYQANKVQVIHNGFDAEVFKAKQSHVRNELEKLFTSLSSPPLPFPYSLPSALSLSFQRSRESFHQTLPQATSKIDSRLRENDDTDHNRVDCLNPNLIFIGTLARFHPDKGYNTLIASIDAICDHHPNARFILCGHGCHVRNPLLNKWLKPLRHLDKIILMDGTDDPLHYLNALDIFVLPSNTEGFPNSLAEAMLCELPCIASDVGEVAYLSNGHAMIIPPNDPTQLTTTCKTLLNKSHKERKQFGDMAREHIKRYYTLAHYKQKMETIYQLGQGTVCAE